MRKLVVLIFAIGVFVQSYSQEKKSIEVDYVMFLDLNADEIIENIPSMYRKQVEVAIREEIKKGIYLDYKLLTNGIESVYQLQPKLNNAQGMADLILNQITSQDSGALVKNLDNMKFTKEVEIMESKYLIKDDLSISDWEILKDTATIAGYSTRKAVGTMNDSIKVNAWFSPKIPIKDGPDKVAGLPGLILKISVALNGKQLETTATKITVREEEIKIKKLTSGKIVSEKEFNNEIEKLQKKMKEMLGSGVDKEN